MAVNHNINVNLRHRGQARTRTRTSAVTGVRRINTGRQTSPSSARQLARGIRTVRTMDTANLGLFGGKSGAIMSVIQETLRLANKAHDVYLSYDLARSGESMSIGNIKRVKGYILNPTAYAIDLTWGRYLQRLEINRENKANAYYRELSGNLVVGNQYRGQR